MISQREPLTKYLQESEISGLLGWSLPWIRAIAVLTAGIGIQSFYFAISKRFGAASAESLLWDSAKGSAYLTLAFYLFRFYQTGKRFVADCDENQLSEAMTYLSVSWISLGLALVITLASLFCDLGNGFFLNASFGQSPVEVLVLLVASIGVIPAVSLFAFRREAKLPYAGGAFLSHINPFAKKSLPRLRFLSVLAIAGGLLSGTFGLVDYSFDITGEGPGAMLTGIALFALGCFLQWYRRSVRDIHRNGTPFFFERTLNRLNFVLLGACVVYGLLFIVGFL